MITLVPQATTFQRVICMKLIFCFAGRRLSLSIPVRKIISIPLRVPGSFFAAQVRVALQTALASPDKANVSMPNCFAPA